ncbi:MAG: sugar phosphate isomerase/epimerase [Acidobacteria bacterium]|nr:sugar phosphate isomerase/epimerase [Acidobacteriota bacterium]
MDSWDGWPLGLSTGCFFQSCILECLEPIRAAGFSRIEVCSFPRHLDYHDRGACERAAARLRELAIMPASFHAPFAESIDITAPAPAERHAALAELLCAAEAAAILGARHFVIHPGPEKAGLPHHERLGRMENAAGVLDHVAARCRELGITLLFENMLPHLFSGAVRDLLWLLGAIEATDVGVCLDTGHALLSGDLHDVVHKLSGHLRMVHASDNRRRFDDHLPPGEGDVPWPVLWRQLAASGFRGAVILEIAGRGSTDEILAGAARARTFLQRLAVGEPAGARR